MKTLRVGQQLGPYAIEGLVGEGGMAEVYRATHLALERTVAIKVLNPELNADPTFPLRFLREAKAVARLNHPNIITLYDFDDRGELAYLVMELAPGGTLRERAAAFRTLSDAVEALAPVCEALHFAHERGVIHRDLKPANVLIDEHGRPRLADFGLARIATETTELTLLGASVGSPHYMSPEQVMGEEVDHRADIYALGIVAYEVLSGRVPYDADMAAKIMAQHLSAPPPSLREALPGAPARLDAAIRRATAKEPADRFGSAAEFLAELRAAAAEAPDLPIRAAAKAPAAPAEMPRADTDRSAAAGNGALGDTLIMPGRAERGAVGRAQARPRVVPIAPADPRPRAFSAWRWFSLGATLLLLAALVALSLWGALGGPVAAPFAHLTTIRNLLAALALVLGLLNASLMRVAVLGDYHLSLDTYFRLRRNHRFVGYTTVLVAITVQALTWLEIWRPGMDPARAALNLLFGTALLLLAVSKIAVVRFVPGLRRYLPWFGVGLGVLLFAVLLVDAVPGL